MEIRLGVVAIVVLNREKAVEVQKVLSIFGDIIIGRMGVPDHATGTNVISLIVKGSVEQISALTGKLGKLGNITVKSAITPAK